MSEENSETFSRQDGRNNNLTAAIVLSAAFVLGLGYLFKKVAAPTTKAPLAAAAAASQPAALRTLAVK